MEDQAYKEIKSAMERDKFDNLSSCLKSWFINKDWEDDVEDKNGFEELYNDYICDQTNKPEE